jgi:peptidoglycan/xylan/chitin deacetylase (PgdA/CDA1 family)
MPEKTSGRKKSEKRQRIEKVMKMDYRDDRQQTSENKLPKDRGSKKRWNMDNRSMIILLNAALILIVVMVAMAIQLVRLDKQGAADSGETTKLAVADSQESTASEDTASTSKKSKDTSKKKKTKVSEISQVSSTIRQDLDPDKPMVALTFDDGPYDKVTDRLVKTLAKHDARATFFVVGNRISRYASSLKKAYDNGNQIATHTYDHGNLTKMSKSQIKKELKKAAKETKKVTGSVPTMLRPPYGTVNKTMRSAIDLPMIYWDVDTQDWSSRNKKKILQRCKNISDGDIVLMHDLYPTTADAVEVLVPRLQKKGFQLVTVEELFYYKGVDAKGGKVYYSAK